MSGSPLIDIPTGIMIPDEEVRLAPQLNIEVNHFRFEPFPKRGDRRDIVAQRHQPQNKRPGHAPVEAQQKGRLRDLRLRGQQRPRGSHQRLRHPAGGPGHRETPHDDQV